MKTFSRINFPAVRINPIDRDLLLLMTTSMVFAGLMVTMVVMLFGH